MRTNSPTCSITGSGTHYTVTVSGLDYSLQNVPTTDSLGTAIPSSTNFVAAGKLTFSFTAPVTASTGVTFTATPTPFTYVDGVVLPETDASNDASSTTIVLPGTFSNQWAPYGPASGRAPWDAELWAAPGTAESYVFPVPGAGTSTDPGPSNPLELPLLSLADSVAWSTYTGPGGADLAGSCSMLSNPADFVYRYVDYLGINGAEDSNMVSAHIWYRTDAIDSKTETCGEQVGVPGSPWVLAPRSRRAAPRRRSTSRRSTPTMRAWCCCPPA